MSSFSQTKFRSRIWSALTVHGLAICLLISSMGCGFTGSTGPPNIAPEEPNVVSLDPANWYIFYSAGMPPHPSDSLVLHPRHQPASDVSASGYRREVVEFAQYAKLRQALKDPQIERGAADAAAGKSKSDQTVADVAVVLARFQPLRAADFDSLKFLLENLAERERRSLIVGSALPHIYPTVAATDNSSMRSLGHRTSSN